MLRGRTDWVAGSGADPADPVPKGRERIRHVYPPALRDAVRDLGSSAATGIQMIIESLLAGLGPLPEFNGPPVTRDGLLAHAESRFGDIQAHPLLAAAAQRVAAPCAD